MLKIAQKARAWVEKVDFGDHEKNLAAFYAQVIALVIIIGAIFTGINYAVAGKFDYVFLMAADVAAHILVVFLIRRKFLGSAIGLLLAFSLGFEFFGIFTAGSIHATSSVLFPVILLFSSLLLNRKRFVIYAASCLAGIGLVIYAENQQISPPYVPDPPELPLFISSGLVFVFTAIFVRFITESLQSTLRKTRQREQELATQKEILDHVGQAVVACAGDNTITYWNKAAADYYGWDANETLGRKYSDVVPNISSPDTLATISAMLRAGKVWAGEFEAQKRDHTILPVIGTIAPLHNEEGRMTGWVGIAADISERKRAEETLRESEDRFKSVFDYSLIGKSITHPTGEVQVNKAFCEMVGYSSLELQNRKWQEITHPDDIDLTQREVNALVSGEKDSTRFTKRFIHKNGSVVWVDLSSTLRRDKNGKSLYLMTSLVDITERKLAEEALRRSEEKFRSFFSNSLDSMFLVDENGLVIEINHATEAMFQVSRQEAIGTPIWEIQYSRAPDNLRPSISLESIRAIVEKATNTGQASWLNHITDSMIQLPDGELRYLQQTSFVIPHSDRFWIANISRDVTESKKADALRVQADTERRTAAMRQRLLDFSREVLSTVDIGEILEITRRTAADLVPHDIFSPYWVDEAEKVFRPIETRGRKWFSDPFFQTWTIPFGYGIMGNVAHKQQAECVNDSHLDPRSAYPPGFQDRFSHEHSIFLPIRSGEKLIGMLVLLRRILPAFTADEFEMAQLLMSLSELALSNARAFAELEQRVGERTAQLAASEERYRLITTVSSDYTFSSEVDADGNLALNWTAGAFEKITGYTYDEYVARGGWRAALHPDDVEQDARDMAALGENRPVTTEVRTIDKSGQAHWVRIYALPVWDAEKNSLTGIYGAVQDITARKQAEEALRASEEKYRGLIELSPVGMWINQGGTITYMNPAALQMLGANSLDQVVGKPALDFIHPRYHAAVQERASRLAGQGENVEPLQEQYIRLDGSLIDVEVTGSVYTTETGRAMQIFFQDITERKRIEERESRSRELLEKVVHLGKTITQVSDLQQCHREIIRCVRQGLDFDRVGLFNYDEETQQVRGVIGTDRTGEIEDTSYFIQTITEGSTWKNTLDDPAGVIHVLDYGERYSSLRQEDEMSDVKEHVTISAWAGEKPIAFLAVDNLITQRRMTPEQIEALRLFVGYVGLAIQKTRWSENLKQRVADLDSINQISQTLVAERELLPLIRAVGDQIRAMFAISVVYIALLDPQANMLDFYYQYENGRFTQGTQLEYGQGMTSRVMELRHPVLINSNWEQEAARYNVIRSGSPSKASLTVPLLVGEKAIGTISLQDTERENIFTEDHVRQLTTIAASLAVAIDNARLHTALQGELLERKQAEEAVRTLNADLEKRVAERTAQLESANRELESLSYTIGHDLRSPIRATVAYSQMLLEELSGQVADSQANKLQVVNQVSLRMGHMVDDFLTFLRLSRSPFQKSRINIAALAEEVIAEQKAEVARRQVLFSVMPMPECVADAHMLKDVLTHLISNAIKFTAHRVPARIEVGATEQQGITCYFVRDNGAGFDMKYSGKLFGVFQRLHRVDEFDGIGIDLAIVQRIIQRHGGRIWAEAEVDNGATFFFTVPPDSINQS